MPNGKLNIIARVPVLGVSLPEATRRKKTSTVLVLTREKEADTFSKVCS